MNNNRLVLYSRPGCHLCDLARSVVAAVDPLLVFEDKDISHDDELTSNYGERIPVLRRCDTGKELEWPYNTEQVKRFLGQL